MAAPLQAKPRNSAPPLNVEDGFIKSAEGVTRQSSAALWARLARAAPSLQRATITARDALAVSAVWSQRDVIASKKRKSTTIYTRDWKNQYVAGMPVPSETETFYSPSRELSVRFVTQDKSLFIEIWRVGRGLVNIWPVEDTLHGPVYMDEWFGGVAWSPDESMFLYIADRPAPKKPDKSEHPISTWAEKVQYKFQEDARDPFGEGFVTRRSPALYIGDISSEKSVLISRATSDKAENILFGDPQWSSDGQYIAVTIRAPLQLDVDENPQHIRHRPYELGLRYCYNRHQAIALLKAPIDVEQAHSVHETMIQISNDDDLDDYCCYSPRFSLDGKDIIYVSYPRTSGKRSEGKVLPHSACKILRTVHLTENNHSKPKTLIPIPNCPSVDDFPGLFMHALPKQPWLTEKTIAFTSAWHARCRVLLASFSRDENGLSGLHQDHVVCEDWMTSYADVLRELNCETENFDFNMMLLDIFDECALIAASSPGTPDQILLVKERKEHGSTECPIALVASVPKSSKYLVGNQFDLHTEFLEVQDDVPRPLEASARPVPRANVLLQKHFQVSVLCPVVAGSLLKVQNSRNEDVGKIPLVVFPHGGPHSVSLHAFSIGTTALLKCGFAVMYVNYRGSLGYGQAALETLPGKVGTQDIFEVVQATRWALDRWNFILDRQKVGFLGGSHSGFQGAHTSLVAGLFKRTVLRNPVVNIASMAGATDIPDWCFCETQLDQKNKNGIPLCADGNQLAVMYTHSPISKIRHEPDPAKRPGPTLLQVGEVDRRVPPQQSLEWKRAMTEAYGTDIVSIRWYPESAHPIDAVPDGDDAWVHALDFFLGM